VLFPNQCQRPGKQDSDQQQYADHGQRKCDVVLTIEQDPRGQNEPADEADRGGIDAWVKLIENRFVVGDKIPGHDSYLLLWTGCSPFSCTPRFAPMGQIERIGPVSSDSPDKFSPAHFGTPPAAGRLSSQIRPILPLAVQAGGPDHDQFLG
jgi:hypothetical protein